MEKSAIIDDTGRYRYLLTRRWGNGTPVLFIMLNPSTADAEKDDATIRKCIGFAKRWNRRAIQVVNLYAYRATDWRELKRCKDPVGPDNNWHIIVAASTAGVIIAAWGNWEFAHDRAVSVTSMLRANGHELQALRVGKSGNPWHPLYVPYEQAWEVYP